jgi:hypothetical protein
MIWTSCLLSFQGLERNRVTWVYLSVLDVCFCSIGSVISSSLHRRALLQPQHRTCDELFVSESGEVFSENGEGQLGGLIGFQVGDGEALVAETRAPPAKRRNSKFQSKRNFQNVPWDYIGIGRFPCADTRNRWEGSLGQQQCRTTVINGEHYAVGVAVALTLDFLGCQPGNSRHASSQP